MLEFQTFENAYLYQLRNLVSRSQFENAPRGQPSLERLGLSFVVKNPRARLITTPGRRTNLVFNFAEALWYLSGRDDLGFLEYYAPSVRRYSRDGQHLTGTAYGPRLFRYGESTIDQWHQVMKTICSDRDTKRAVILLFHPSELAIDGNPDVACTIGLQFLLRQERLNCIAFMRANDGYRGIVSDVFSFTLIQEVMARQLNVDVGMYVHFVGSSHVYKRDMRIVERVLSEESCVNAPMGLMAPMPAGDNMQYVSTALTYEARLRRNELRLDDDLLDKLEMPTYWKDVVILFELYRRVRFGLEGDEGTLLHRLPEVYRYLLLNRFSSLRSGEAN